jgi:hypothetical protein
MSKRYQNIFFFFGLAVLALMVSQLDFADVWEHIRHAGYWFIAVVALWGFLYLFNTLSWYIIIRSGNPDKKVSFFWLYKITVSGFALNYATPGGLMGGEPYRIMTLAPHIGTEKASASVILFAMTHIFSHFWFWLASIVLFVLTQPVSIPMALLLCATGAFCLLAIWFFLSGYRKGLAFRAMNLLRHVPYVKRWASGFIERHREALDRVDQQIASLHNQNPRTFFSAVLSEFTCRVCSALEVYFVLRVLMPHVSYIDCILVLAFTTLFANMLFFMPLQLGGREGGFLMSVKGLAMSTDAAILVALLVRVRELIWTAIGLLLIKVGKDENDSVKKE